LTAARRPRPFSGDALMRPLLTLRLALRSLLRNKVRTALTMLGIMIGIASVIAMIAIGQGASLMIQQQVNTLGSNMLTLFPSATTTGGVSLGAGSRPTLTPEDGAAIAKEIENVKGVCPVVYSRGQAAYGNRNWWVGGLRGEGSEYLVVKGWALEEGDFYTDTDITAGNKVCAIGLTVRDALFEDESPVGKTIRVRNMPFRVLGVLGRKGTGGHGEDQDDVVIIPWTTVRRVLQGASVGTVDALLVSAVSPGDVPQLNRDIAALLRQRHRLAEQQENDFKIMTMNEMIETATETSRTMTQLLALIASISLIVGGIGIMNIMLVAVAERTREIGLRMAVGARGRDILLQFLAESVVLSALAGLAGVGIGVVASHVISSAKSWPVAISPDAVGLSVLCACGVGIGFGLYPAFRASRLNPIEALRYE
jgi:putative ABC transport system permease protein